MIKMSSTSGATKKQKLAPVRVFLRIRPRLDQDGPSAICYSTPKEIRVEGHTKTYSFDQIFDDKTSQNKVYKTVVGSIIADVVKGYNCTVFAYGQTGTGKTYTILGKDSINTSDDAFDKNEDTDAGIIVRAAKHLYDELDKIDKSIQYTVTVSFMEIYNEEIRDLLSDKEVLPLRIYEDKAKSVRVKNLQEHTVLNVRDILNLLNKGCEKRQIASTLMNNRSSRSHTVFTINVGTIQTISVAGNISNIICGKLSLIDLAGSENIAKSGSKDQRAREASNINLSLLTLGRVIKALVENSPHVPYRESKLTRILQDSLGGKSKTAIIATIAPGMSSVDETVNTLDYAFSARHITNCPIINLRSSATAAAIHEEVLRLKRDLFATANEQGVYMDKENYEDITKSLLEYKKDIIMKHDTIQSLNEKLDDLTAQKEEWENLRKSFEITRQAYQECQSEVQSTKGLLEKDQLLLNYYEKEIVKSEEFAQQLAMNENYLYQKINELYGMSNSNKKVIEKVIKEVEDELDDTVNKFSHNSQRTHDQLEQLSVFKKNICHMLSDVKKQLDGRIRQSTFLCNALSSTENESINDPLSKCSREYLFSMVNNLKTSKERCEKANKLKQQAIEAMKMFGLFKQDFQKSTETILEQVAQKKVNIENLLSEEIKQGDAIFGQIGDRFNERMQSISNILLEASEQLSRDEESLQEESLEFNKRLQRRQLELAERRKQIASMKQLVQPLSCRDDSSVYMEEQRKHKDRICDFTTLEKSVVSHSQNALHEISTIGNVVSSHVDISNILQTKEAVTEATNQQKQALEFIQVIEQELKAIGNSYFEVASVVDQIGSIVDLEGNVKLEHLNEIMKSHMQLLNSKNKEIKSKMHQIFNTSFVHINRTGDTPKPMKKNHSKRSSRDSIVRKLIMDNNIQEENANTNSSG